MGSSLGENLETAWPLAFAEARFPSFVVDAEGKVLIANMEGQAWLSRNDLAQELRRHGSPSLALEPERLVELTGADVPPGLIILGLPDGRALICLCSSGCELVADFVRLFRSFLRSEEMLKKRTDRLEVYHELLTHDAPNYITAVYGYLQMIQAQELPREKLQKYIDTSVRQTEALNHMIDTARTLRQLEIDPLRATEILDLGPSVEEAIASVQAANTGKPSEIQDRIPTGPHRVAAEPGLEEVFRIILTNAVRYSDSPRVTIDLVDEGDDWHLLFTDNGRGIPDDKKEFLFMRFDRLDKQKKIRGSGLSLALARALVERHNGRIWVDNTVPGDHTKGSVFHVRLPKAQGMSY
jgi:signal transduction histidine kinase